MRGSRASRWHTVVFTVLALVLSQASIAAHACGMASQSVEAAAMAAAGMPCAAEMAAAADEAAALCHSHCQSSQGTSDHFTPHIADLSQAPAVLTVDVPQPVQASAGAHALLPARAATGPPLAIANCCFRI